MHKSDDKTKQIANSKIQLTWSLCWGTNELKNAVTKTIIVARNPCPLCSTSGAKGGRGGGAEEWASCGAATSAGGWLVPSGALSACTNKQNTTKVKIM